MANIGDRRSDGKIFAGPDYGYQSPASYFSLQDEGAFKIGAQTVRRLTNAIEERLPQPVKDFGQWYGESDQRANQRLLERGYTQEQINAQKVKDSQYQGQGDATSQFLQDVSDKTNVAEPLVQLLAGGTEMVVTGGVARAMSKNALRGLSRAPAPSAFAMGDDLQDASSIAKRIQQQADKRPPFKAGFDKDGRPINLETGGRMPSTTSRIDGTNRTDGQDIRVSRVETTPDTNPSNKGRTEAYVFNPVGPERRVSDAVTARRQLAPEVVKDTRPRPTPVKEDKLAGIIPGGSTRNVPKSQAQFDAPADQKIKRRRQFVEEADTGEWLPDEEVLTSDMARPKSDGNQYNLQDNAPKDIPAVERQRIRRESISKREQQAVSKKIEQRLKENNTDGLKREVFLADGDYQKLEAIAKELGIDASKYKNASQLERALEKKISGIENTYGGKASLSKEERKAVTDQFDRETLTGATRAEQKRLTELATEEFGDGQPKRKPIKPLKDTRVKANRQPDIERRKRAYGQPETEEGNFDYDTRERLDIADDRREYQFYMDRYQWKPMKDKSGKIMLQRDGKTPIPDFKTEDGRYYVPKRRERSASDSINRRRSR